MHKERKNSCPKCGGVLFAREGSCVICVAKGCDWAIQKKRKTDDEIPTIHEYRRDEA